MLDFEELFDFVARRALVSLTWTAKLTEHHTSNLPLPMNKLKKFFAQAGRKFLAKQKQNLLKRAFESDFAPECHPLEPRRVLSVNPIFDSTAKLLTVEFNESTAADRVTLLDKPMTSGTEFFLDTNQNNDFDTGEVFGQKTDLLNIDLIGNPLTPTTPWAGSFVWSQQFTL
ncbi:MAG: hypothetical protein ACOYOZ_16540, partial [Pirellula sp.]